MPAAAGGSPTDGGRSARPDTDRPADDAREDARDKALTQALDRIRARFGAASILPAGLVDRRQDPGPRVEEDPA
jgi:hypothetical protein